MYQYAPEDKKIITERVSQFRQQTDRYLNGDIEEAAFLPLRLQNGLYIQRHAPMLRIAIPYGMLNSNQLRCLAKIARDYDKNYGHFTTRQNIQFNWPHLEDVPDILDDLAKVEMHGVQTSGNCIRNVTSDEFAGVDAEELTDPRPYCELIRQWSTFHPEFAYLPRKFKIAVSAHPNTDRAAILAHDIGLQLIKNATGETGFKVFVGGGLGRTPIIGSLINDFCPEADILSYLEAILRVYNRYGRRDNKYKARIKILVKALGPDAFKQKVAEHWHTLKHKDAMRVSSESLAGLKSRFTHPSYQILNDMPASLNEALAKDALFKDWYEQNTAQHKQSGYRIAIVSLKATGDAPGDVTGEQLSGIADLADDFSSSEIRVAHTQNLVFADVKQSDLYPLWQRLGYLGLATANAGLLTDVICCPGGDFCALANAKSIPIAQSIQQHFSKQYDLAKLGNITLNISGCMNACGHHHIGNIGILGVAH